MPPSPDGAFPQAPDDDMSRMEEVYDAEIAPLMTQIIAICKRADIPVHASFKLDGDLACTTHIAPPVERVDEDFEAWEAPYRAATRKAVGSSPLMLTVRNAAGDVTRMEAIL